MKKTELLPNFTGLSEVQLHNYKGGMKYPHGLSSFGKGLLDGFREVRRWGRHR